MIHKFSKVSVAKIAHTITDSCLQNLFSLSVNNPQRGCTWFKQHTGQRQEKIKFEPSPPPPPPQKKTVAPFILKGETQWGARPRAETEDWLHPKAETMAHESSLRGTEAFASGLGSPSDPEMLFKLGTGRLKCLPCVWQFGCDIPSKTLKVSRSPIPSHVGQEQLRPLLTLFTQHLRV